MFRKSWLFIMFAHACHGHKDGAKRISDAGLHWEPKFVCLTDFWFVNIRQQQCTFIKRYSILLIWQYVHLSNYIVVC